MRHRSFTERGLPCRDGPKLATFSCIPTGRYGGQIETATSSSSTVRLPASALRKNCGTRDRREARSILRECGDRLRNGEYAASGGAIIAAH